MGWVCVAQNRIATMVCPRREAVLTATAAAMMKTAENARWQMHTATTTAKLVLITHCVF